MRKWILLVLLGLPLCLKSQIITLIGGGGTGGDGGTATSASIHSPEHMVFDRNGNLYFTENLTHKIRKISTTGIITTIVGTVGSGFGGDGGLATAAKIKQPGGIAVDALDNIYFCDQENHRIRKINAVTGIITTVAGTGTAGYNGDGIPATAAHLHQPWGVSIDQTGNLYISDNVNYRLRKVNTSGIITTIAGNGSSTGGGDGIPATIASCGPGNIGFDAAGNIYMSDLVYYTIRKINTAGIISTVAGKNGLYIYNGDGIPATNAHIAPTYIAVDGSGNIYIPDAFNDRIRRVNTSGIIETVAGDGTPGFSGDGGLAILAKINNPSSVILDTCGNLFLSQLDNPRIRKVTFNPECWPVNVKEIKSSECISIYPNPANNELTIMSTENIKRISISNTVGQSFDKATNDKKKIVVDISHLPMGMYFVKVNELYVQRFLKE